MLPILTRSGSRGGTGEEGGEMSETSGGVGGGGMCRIIFLIKFITLRRETFASSSSSPHGGEIKGLFSSPLLLSFLYVFPLGVALDIKVIA